MSDLITVYAQQAAEAFHAAALTSEPDQARRHREQAYRLVAKIKALEDPFMNGAVAEWDRALRFLDSTLEQAPGSHMSMA